MAHWRFNNCHVDSDKKHYVTVGWLLRNASEVETINLSSDPNNRFWLIARLTFGRTFVRVFERGDLAKWFVTKPRFKNAKLTITGV